MRELYAQSKSDLRIIWPFVPVLVAFVLLGAFSVDLLSSVRAYVNGESMWSKREKIAVIHLLRYADTHDEAEFEGFNKAVEFQEVDRQARLALEQPHLDRARITKLLIAGNNAPKDVPGMIRLFRNFRTVPGVARAIDVWTRSDSEIALLHEYAGQLQKAVHTGQDVTSIVQNIEATDARLTILEDAFSNSLGDVSRQLRDTLIPGMGIAALLMLLPCVLIVLRDMRRERETSRQFAYEASHDALTGLCNRREFERRLEQAIEQVQKSGGSHSLMFLDLDQFKVVNDTCGHATGDELLREVAELMRARLRKTDTLARLGGDEFCVLLEQCDLEDGERVAESIRDSVAHFRFERRSRTFTLAVSIGMIRLDSSIGRVPDALSAADAACYMAKMKGRNRVQVYAQSDDAVRYFHEEMEWVSRVNAALADGRFCLHAQEITPLKSGSDAGRHIELLLRMVDLDGRLVPPMDFIPACERYSLMPQIDRWVIDAAFAELALRNAARPGEIVFCSVNLSAASLADETLPAYIEERAKHYGTPLKAICFEITETAAVQNLEQAQAFIARLQGMGCRFALDDFGVGMASLAYLKHLPAEYIKIDGLFIHEMLEKPVNLAVIEAIQRIGLVTGHRTIAEHVDSGEKMERLRELGVDFAQGFGVGHFEHFAGRHEGSTREMAAAG
jgi:diguanylate cyclase (GGDEF)-like protein